MDITLLIQTAHPELSGPLECLRDPAQRAALERVKQQTASDEVITLRDLIRIAKQADLPSIKLSQKAMDMLIEKLTIRCRAEAIAVITRNMGRSLTLVPNFLWASQIHFYPARVALPRSPNAVRGIREDIKNA